MFLELGYRSRTKTGVRPAILIFAIDLANDVAETTKWRALRGWG